MLPYALTQFPCREVNALRRMAASGDLDARLVLALLVEVIEERDRAVAALREARDAADEIGAERDEAREQAAALRAALAEAVAGRAGAVAEANEVMEGCEEIWTELKNAAGELARIRAARSKGGRKPFGTKDGEREKVRRILRLHGEGLSYGRSHGT